jgi:hypothetical protein
MSNTGTDKKLASFNCDTALWSEFRSRCTERGTTATAVLTRCIQWYLAGSLEDLATEATPERIKAMVDEYLAESLDSHVMSILSKRKN